ncbi:hypothetical protein CY652_13440 [Burkholderia sp. WAC0059]|nr:hypothetical protein CY652_13440 [Burkholderia sp. WAC0059]
MDGGLIAGRVAEFLIGMAEFPSVRRLCRSRRSALYLRYVSRDGFTPIGVGLFAAARKKTAAGAGFARRDDPMRPVRSPPM